METKMLEVRSCVRVLEKNLFGKQIVERLRPGYWTEEEVDQMLEASKRGEKTELPVSPLNFTENVFLIGTPEKSYTITLVHIKLKEGGWRWRKSRWSLEGRQYYIGSTLLFVK